MDSLYIILWICHVWKNHKKSPCTFCTICTIEVKVQKVQIVQCKNLHEILETVETVAVNFFGTRHSIHKRGKMCHLQTDVLCADATQQRVFVPFQECLLILP